MSDPWTDEAREFEFSDDISGAFQDLLFRGPDGAIWWLAEYKEWEEFNERRKVWERTHAD